MVSREIELEIIEKYESGLSTQKVGELVGYGRTTIRKVLEKYNITTRTPKEARCAPKGSQSSTWTGGNQKYWNRQCKIRDDYTCQICGFREPEIMVADHILPKSMYPELKFEMNNLVTLCPNCHARKTQREKKNKEYNKIIGEI